MWLRESARRAEHARNVTVAARPLEAIKYHGKWPFTRLLGMQVRADDALTLLLTFDRRLSSAVGQQPCCRLPHRLDAVNPAPAPACLWRANRSRCPWRSPPPTSPSRRTASSCSCDSWACCPSNRAALRRGPAPEATAVHGTQTSSLFVTALFRRTVSGHDIAQHPPCESG